MTQPAIPATDVLDWCASHAVSDDVAFWLANEYGSSLSQIVSRSSHSRATIARRIADVRGRRAEDDAYCREINAIEDELAMAFPAA